MGTAIQVLVPLPRKQSVVVKLLAVFFCAVIGREGGCRRKALQNIPMMALAFLVRQW